MTKQVSTNCRTVVAININSPVVCSKMKLGNLLKFNAAFSPMWGHRTNKEGTEQIDLDGEGSDPNWIKDEGGKTIVDLENLPGKCRFDPYRAMVDPNSACLCVATQETCTKNRDGCYWHEDPDTHYKECISKAERFYNQLYALLSKRGKKSFAINIRYGATPARGNLPYGPWGPAIIGYGNPSPSQQIGLFRRRGPGPARPMQPFALDQQPQPQQPPNPFATQSATATPQQSEPTQEAGVTDEINTDRQAKGGLGLLNMLQMSPSNGAYGTGGMAPGMGSPAGSMGGMSGMTGGMSGMTGGMSGMSGGMQGGMYGGMSGMTGGMQGGLTGGMQGGLTGGMQGSLTGGMGGMPGMTGGMIPGMGGLGGSMSGGMGSSVPGGMNGGMQGGLTGGMNGMHGMLGGMGGMQSGMTGGMNSLGSMTGGMGGMTGMGGGMGGMTGGMEGMGGGMTGDIGGAAGMVGDMGGMDAGMGVVPGGPGSHYFGKKKRSTPDKKKRSTEKRRKRNARKKREDDKK